MGLVAPHLFLLAGRFCLLTHLPVDEVARRLAATGRRRLAFFDAVDDSLQAARALCTRALLFCRWIRFLWAHFAAATTLSITDCNRSARDAEASTTVRRAAATRLFCPPRTVACLYESGVSALISLRSELPLAVRTPRSTNFGLVPLKNVSWNQWSVAGSCQLR